MATPGAIDDFNCHRAQDTGEYHCHGSKAQAKQYHVLIGALISNDLWFYDNGPFNMFSGVGGQLEIAWGPLAAYGAYHYQWHMTGSSDFSIRGWDLGVKAGPDIARLGVHPYAMIGHFSNTFEIRNRFIPYRGLEYGAGLIANQAKTSIDLRILYRNPQDLRMVWQDLNYPGLTTNLSVQLGFHLRF